MPTTKQIDANRDTANFSPVRGGTYNNGTLDNKALYGYWWGSEAYGGAWRYSLYYNGSSLYTGNSTRRIGLYVRCVSEEKTVTDLTYLQDMTGEIANNKSSISFHFWRTKNSPEHMLGGFLRKEESLVNPSVITTGVTAINICGAKRQLTVKVVSAN